MAPPENSLEGTKIVYTYFLATTRQLPIQATYASSAPLRAVKICREKLHCHTPCVG